MIIRIRNLRIAAIIGIHDWEREHRQNLTINVELEYDGSNAAASDDIADALDYSALKKRIIAVTEASDFGLLEALADRLVRLCMEDTRVSRARVEIDKPAALSQADSVSVTAEDVRK
jgi:dihydroneopterin aldolase